MIRSHLIGESEPDAAGDDRGSDAETEYVSAADAGAFLAVAHAHDPVTTIHGEFVAAGVGASAGVVRLGCWDAHLCEGESADEPKHRAWPDSPTRTLVHPSCASPTAATVTTSSVQVCLATLTLLRMMGSPSIRKLGIIGTVWTDEAAFVPGIVVMAITLEKRCYRVPSRCPRESSHWGASHKRPPRHGR